MRRSPRRQAERARKLAELAHLSQLIMVSTFGSSRRDDSAQDEAVRDAVRGTGEGTA